MSTFWLKIAPFAAPSVFAVKFSVTCMARAWPGCNGAFNLAGSIQQPQNPSANTAIAPCSITCPRIVFLISRVVLCAMN